MERNNNQFEEMRLYAIYSFILMSLIYMGISTFYLPHKNTNYGPFFDILFIFILSIFYNFIRYRYLSTVQYASKWIFFAYGCIDLFFVSYYFGVPTLDQGGKAVIMFILIIASIYRGRKIGITLTLIWLPIKVISQFFFTLLSRARGGADFHNMINSDYIISAIYFEVMLLILVYITNVIYRQIVNKEKENERLLNKLEQHYKELNDAHIEIEEQNEKLKGANQDLENVNKKLAYSVSEFYTLQQVSQAIGSILDMDKLMKFVNDITLGVMGVKSSTIILFNEELSKLQVHSTNITDEHDYTLLNDNINCQILKNILVNNSPVCDNNADSNKYIFSKGRNVKSFICVPIIAKIKKFGLILIEQDFSNAFDDDKVRLLTVIGQQVGMAMENAELYQEMRELAVRDSLTGTYNRLYLRKRLGEELLKAQMESEELTIVMFDIDHFKKINDTYGHLFGDKVLKHLSDLVNGLIRNTDVFARIGGEEFIILLPNTSLIQAGRMIERIREKIADTVIKDNAVSALVTVSFGISNYPHDSSSIVDLLRNADNALYVAKNSGRNCVRTAV